MFLGCAVFLFSFQSSDKYVSLYKQGNALKAIHANDEVKTTKKIIFSSHRGPCQGAKAGYSRHARSREMGGMEEA
jgi:hypothetical protein